jgi:hypothetical protein
MVVAVFIVVVVEFEALNIFLIHIRCVIFL